VGTEMPTGRTPAWQVPRPGKPNPEGTPAWVRICSARKRDGTPCRAPAVAGAAVCAMHGGSHPQVQRVAAERVKEGIIASKWRELSLSPTDFEIANPSTVLLMEISWTAAFIELLRIKLGELGHEDLTWGIVKRVDKGSGTAPGIDTTEAAEVNALVKLLGTERDRLTRQVETAVKLDLDRRVVESHERIGRMIVSVLESSLDVITLTVDQRSAVRGELRRQLIAIGASE